MVFYKEQHTPPKTPKTTTNKNTHTPPKKHPPNHQFPRSDMPRYKYIRPLVVNRNIAMCKPAHRGVNKIIKILKEL